jgi:hypothetical protein
MRENPLQNHLIIYILAGHGMHDNGKQIVLLNEWDGPNSFYKVWNVEEDIEKIAETY